MFDDAKVRELRHTIDAHTAHGGDALAMQALEGLGAIRSDFAILHIHAIATRASGKLKKRAQQILGDVCRQRGLSDDELEDRIVPELGLDDRGTMLLDYGSRKFTVGFDELLQPFVRDEAGVRLAGLPHVGKTDDAEKAASAQAKWKTLKDDVKMIGVEQSRRLERSMCELRSWSAETFSQHLVTHRLLGHLARRLVFGVLEDHEVKQTFRVAEDGTFANQDDETIVLSDDARVVIVHPARIDEATRLKWRTVLDDYKVMQTFAQLDREHVAISSEDLTKTVTSQFAGMQAHGGSFFALRKRGWTIGGSTVNKVISTAVRAALDLSPGIDTYGSKPEAQTLGDLHIVGRTFAALPPIVRYELLRDVVLLIGTANEDRPKITP